MNKFVLLNFGLGIVQTGFDDISMQVWSDSSSGSSHQYRASLPPNVKLATCYGRWQELYSHLLKDITVDKLPVRPHRHEPRVVKRRPKPFSRMKQPRSVLKEKLAD